MWQQLLNLLGFSVNINSKKQIWINHVVGRTKLAPNSLCKQWYYRLAEMERKSKVGNRKCSEKKKKSLFRKLTCFLDEVVEAKNSCSRF